MDLICYSHLRWNFVYQRPQHLLSRFAKQFRVLFVEEPIFDTDEAFLDTKESDEKVWIIVPHMPAGLTTIDNNKTQQKLLKDLFEYFAIDKFIAWYYTPMALAISDSFTPDLVVFDCMDELSAFKNAPAQLKQMETDLLEKADIVFTGGLSLFEAKKGRHDNLHCFPSSIDQKHFEKARLLRAEPADHWDIPHPRIGFFGVIDERMDIELLDTIARQKPDWHFVIIGPTVKIDPASLPAHPNIHYLGSKSYNELPGYLSAWDVAMMPFAMNESTRFISPTKTPEYLAAGKPVVSTPIHDVVVTYGQEGLVCIAATPDEFIAGIQQSLDIKDPAQWLKSVDAYLDQDSWDTTVEKMMVLMAETVVNKTNDTLIQKQKEDEYV